MALTDLGIIVPTADTVSLRRAIAFGLENLLNKVRLQNALVPSHRSADIRGYRMHVFAWRPQTASIYIKIFQSVPGFICPAASKQILEGLAPRRLAQVEQKAAMAGIGEDIFAIALDQPFRFPASFTFVLRAFTTLEGLGRALDPNYKFASVAQPYALDLLQLQVRGRAL